jgi:O-antigen/teichoic acid export membrane protein
MKPINKFLNMLGRKKAKQIGSLYTTMVIGMVIGVGTSIVNTRFLGPRLYGDFQFLVQLFNFVVMFLTVGIFMSGSRLLAREDNRGKEQAISGAMLTFGAAISILMIVGFFVFSFFEERIFDNDLGYVMRLFSPFLFVFPLRLCIENIMMGTNEIYKLSIFRLFPKIFYLAGALAVQYTIKLTLKAALLLNLLGFALIVVIMLFLLKPKFTKVKENWRMLVAENKTYGLQVYISHLANTATTRVAAVSIAYFIDNTNVGYYALALTITAPLALIPRVVGTTFFKDFANRDSIPGKATAATVSLAAGALLIFLLIIKTLFYIIYTRDFAPALPIVYFFAFSSVIHGFADYVNRFLGAHGKGKDMRNSGFIVAGANLLGYVLLVYYFQLDGAIITRVAASIIYLVSMLYFYRKLRKESTAEAAESAGEKNPH